MPPRGALGRLARRRRRSESIAARIFAFLGAFVVQLTKRLKLAEEAFLLITLMWLDVVCDRRSIDAPIFQAHLAQWLRT